VEAFFKLFAALMTIPVFIPFIMFALVYFSLNWKHKNRRMAITYAVNVTTFFLITAVVLMHGMIKDVDSLNAIWWITIFFSTMVALIVWLQLKVKGKTDIPRMFRAVWRLAFVFFTLAYFFLFISSLHYYLQLT
jgi:hypothetical protein